MSSEWRSLEYQWLSSDGGVNVVTHMSLVFESNDWVDYDGENRPEINRLVDVRCDRVEFGGCGFLSFGIEFDRVFLNSFAEAFRACYGANRLNLQDDVHEYVLADSVPFHDDAYRAV